MYLQCFANNNVDITVEYSNTIAFSIGLEIRKRIAGKENQGLTINFPEICLSIVETSDKLISKILKHNLPLLV